MNLIDGKDKVSASTNFLLNLINKIYQGDELFPIFLKSLDFSNKAPYKLSILEFMNVLAPGCNNYFSSVQAVKSCVIKVATIMSEFVGQKRILPACYSLINYMRDIDAESTIGALASLKAFMLSTVLSICNEYSTDIEREVKTYKSIGRERPKTPEVSSSPVRNSKTNKITNHYKLNNTMTIDSPSKKANYSFVNNDSRSPSSLLDNSEVNTSSLTANYASETRKMGGSPNRLSKNLKHTASNPNLQSTQYLKPKPMPSLLKQQQQQQQHSPARHYQKSKTVMIPREETPNPKTKLMKFDFDDEDEGENNDYDLDESVKKSIQIVEIEDRKSDYSPKPSLTSVGTTKSVAKPPRDDRNDYMSKPSTATSISTNKGVGAGPGMSTRSIKDEKPDLNSLEGIKRAIE